MSEAGIEEQTAGIQAAYHVALEHLADLDLFQGCLVLACEGVHGCTVETVGAASFRRLFVEGDPQVLPVLDRALATAAALGGLPLFCQDRGGTFWTCALMWVPEPDPANVS